MHNTLEQKLVKKYPVLFKQYGGDMSKTCMHWGMSCGNGWYKIIDELCTKLEPYHVVASQVKEKFGSLRFYLESAPSEFFEEIYAHIDKSEIKSAKTCETCGSPATIRGEGWFRCICDDCEKKSDIVRKIRDEYCKYKIIEPHQIVIYNDKDGTVFKGKMSDLIELLSMYTLNLLKE